MSPLAPVSAERRSMLTDLRANCRRARRLQPKRAGNVLMDHPLLPSLRVAHSTVSPSLRTLSRPYTKPATTKLPLFGFRLPSLWIL